jgi:type VI secretion system protein ImpH
MPLHLTEYARERLRNDRDPTMAAFADMFHHRMFSLFYRAWAAGEPAASFDRPDRDPFGDYVAALSGVMGQSMSERDRMPDLSKRHFAGFMGSFRKTETGLLAMLSSFFRAPAKITSFVGSWLELEPADRWMMGRPAVLGRSAAVGSRVWSRQAKFRIQLGPMPLADYERLLPGGASLEKLSALVRNYIGDELDWDVNLVLRAEDTPPTVLGQQGKLGWTTWIGNRPAGQDADDLHLQAPKAA